MKKLWAFLWQQILHKFEKKLKRTVLFKTTFIGLQQQIYPNKKMNQSIQH